jgi:hypothetical protein
MQEAGKGNKIDIDRQQHQFNRHQNNDDVFTIQEYPENSDGKQRCRQ